jgi:hypothetical protein
MSVLGDDFRKLTEPGLLVSLAVLLVLLAASDLAIWLAYSMDTP